MSASRPSLETTNPYISYRSYNTTQKVVGLLIEYGAIPASIKCDRANCNNTECRIKFISRKERVLAKYTCKGSCSFTRALLNGSIFEGTKLSMDQVWHVLVGYIEVHKLKFGRCLEITETTMSLYNTALNQCAKTILNSAPYRMIGGKDVVVQADETYLISGKKGPCGDIPSNAPDNTRNAIWVVGAIAEGTQEVWAEVVPNRKKTTMAALFKRRVREGSILVTDGHPSYPFVARSCNYEHRKVIHKKERVNEDGDHTNQIESFWSFLGSMNKGVTRGNASLFVYRAVFTRRFLAQDQPDGLRLLLSEAFPGQVGDE